MASPSSSSSCLSSTCGLLSFLDLNDKDDESMEELETECILDVPDTPDQLTSQKINGRQFVQMDSSSDVEVEKGMNGMKEVGVLASENGHDLRLDSSSNNFPGNDFKSRNTIILSPGEKSSSQNHFLLRKGGREKYSCQRLKPFNYVDSPSIPPVCQENTAVPEVREPDHKCRPQMVCPHVFADDCTNESLSNRQSALKRSNMIIKGKEKVEDSFQDVGLSNNTNNQHEKQVSDSRQFVSSPTRAAGHKSLVRNGCISPHNIAIKSKCFTEQKSCRTVDKSNLGNMQSSSPSCPIDMKDIVAKDNYSNKDKGKGIIRQPSTSHVDDDDDDARDICASSSDMEKDVQAIPARTSQLSTSESSEEVGDWRITHNNSRKGLVLPNPSESSFKYVDNVGRFSNQKTESIMERQILSRHEQGAQIDFAGNADTTQRASGNVPKMDRTIGRMHSESKLNKRQKKLGLTSQIHTSSLQDVVHSAPGESSKSGSTRLQSRRICDNFNEVIEVDKLSPVTKYPVSHTVGCPNDDTSDAKIKQLEADERLARELQEQLYQEMPLEEPVEEEIDAHLAMALQQMDGLFAPSRRTYNTQRGSLVSQANRRTRSQSLQNSNRTLRTQVTNSAQMAQIRNRFFGGSHGASTRQRNVNFPLYMDLDTRLDILEALEAAVGDTEDVRINRDILHIQRDFNENDYEMLLSLDENNHHHAGASTNRINSLPQSTVQIDSMEETCAICLEMPTIGDVIRHLPCLHKFHKDCIDPWLQRRTSCPVCKLSIT